MPLPDDWADAIGDELRTPYGQALHRFVAEERATHRIFPPANDVFAAMRMTPWADVRVVVLGQDPYHGRGQAHGLSFSVPIGVPKPPSLRNILKELHDDCGCPPRQHGDLSGWASQGVLLLNTTLTVREGQPGSHHGHGWERFTDRVIVALGNRGRPTVFVLWGRNARSKRALIASPPHAVIESPHPSPLSASRGFFGSKPFSAVNAALSGFGEDPIDWCAEPT